MQNTRNRLGRGSARLGLLATGAAVAALTLPAVAQAAPSMSVFARGIDNPRQLSMAPNGTLYVASAGNGGGQCVGPRREQTCFGFSSKVLALSPSGAKRTVASNLLSVAGPDGSFATGADGVGAGSNGTVATVITSATPREIRGTPRRVQSQAGQLFRVLPRPLTDVASIDQFEWDNNSDGVARDLNSNPYAVLTFPDRYVVADAGANAIVEVRGARVSLLATIRGPGRIQRVPSSLATDSSGAIYVGELAEGAGTGRARVLRIPPQGGRPEVVETGFTTITGLAFDRDDNLYVTELVTNARGFGRAPGRISKITAADARRTSFSRGLMFPQGAAVDAEGNVYVSNFSTLPASTPRRSPFRGAGGQVVKITGL
jgi:SMP-30/gluconolaconase/LRE-like protein